MEPPPRSLALDAHYCIMVRVAWPTEYKYASAIGCACWRAPLGIDSVPNTTCDRRPNAEPMASAFPGSRRGHGRPSNKQRGQTTRTSDLTEITPYKCLALGHAARLVPHSPTNLSARDGPILSICVTS